MTFGRCLSKMNASRLIYQMIITIAIDYQKKFRYVAEFTSMHRSGTTNFLSPNQQFSLICFFIKKSNSYYQNYHEALLDFKTF